MTRQVILPSGIGAGLNNITVLVEKKATPGVGGTFPSGGWEIRTLDTILAGADNIVSLSSNEFTLFDVDYLMLAYATANLVDAHQTRLYNVTTATGIEGGISAYSAVIGTSIVPSFLSAFIPAPGAEQTYRIEHQCNTTRNNTGFGTPGFSPESTQFTVVWLFKLG